jgi:purine-binding chemotaxis protein CheW
MADMPQETAQQEGTATMESEVGKYLTFRLANEEYGIGILSVVEIIKMMPVTSVPRVPDYVRGVINLRGKVIPVLDLRGKFGMETIEDTTETCIIVVNAQDDSGAKQMGVLVDTVSEVLDIKADEIEPPPQFGGDINMKFILGMAKAKGTVKTLLNIGEILAAQEIAAGTGI